MSLTRIFAKPIDRPIEGVIKADDDASLRSEVEEYVLTNEIQKSLDAFLSAYNDYQGANGVWLSGFFGSGKSHLLKMLALLLENREFDDLSVLDEFMKKSEDRLLQQEMKKAASVPSQSILFNIDQKADIISKQQFDALLSVFVKVFDEACGYYGKQGYIAKFERDLDERGQLDDFRQVFENIAGKPWERGREEWLLEQGNVSKAFAEISGQDVEEARNILQKYRDDYQVSIEDFAEMVKRHIDRHGDDFRLNFYVDEVGQFIAGNTKLMTNLQTIAESLATKCRGRSWIIVTAQEEMDSVIGNMTRNEGEDFTKIQARFKNRLKLTSTNVAEVIQRRLLKKTEEARPEIEALYEEHSANFRTFLEFTGGSKTYKNFRDAGHFNDCYPFIPYQFDLFQEVIQSLSLHNVFEGKHSSVGERSMLAVFQEVARQIGDREMGQLATFDLMFEGIRTALKSGAVQPILTLERNASNSFSPRLLKVLFLVKYVRGFKATVHNLAILMLESFDENVSELHKQVQEALNWLESQTYIQRNGEIYEYLTDEEKDIEQEIKSTEIDNADVLKLLDDLTFDRILRQRKIRYEENGQDYPFSRKIDDKLYNREQELAIHLISPLHDNAESLDRVRGYSVSHPTEVVVLLPADDRLLRDLGMYLKTDKYFRQHISQAQKDEVRRILTDKQSQNQQRQVHLEERLRRLLGQATLFVAGKELESSSQDAQTRIIQGFQDLVQHIYPNLRMLRGHKYSEEQIAQNLRYTEGELLSDETASLPEPEQEMLTFILGNQRSSVRTTIKSVLEEFGRRPYGWYQAAILCTLARLVARGKIDLRADSNLLEGEDQERAFHNSHGYANVRLVPQVSFSAAQIRQIKEFYSDFFNDILSANEPKALGQALSEASDSLYHELRELHAQVSEFPFLSELEPALEKLDSLRGKDYDWYFTELPKMEDELIELKDDAIDPIRRFMAGSQKEIYREARQFLQDQDTNLRNLRNDPVTVDDQPDKGAQAAVGPGEITELLDDPKCYRSNRVASLRGLLDSLQVQIDKQLEAAKADAYQHLDVLHERLRQTAEYRDLEEGQRGQLQKEFDTVRNEIDRSNQIPLVRDRINRFEQEGYTQLLNQLAVWVEPPAPEPTSGDDESDSRPREPAAKMVGLRDLNIDYTRPWLSTEDEVDAYLDALRQALMEKIRKGKSVRT